MSKTFTRLLSRLMVLVLCTLCALAVAPPARATTYAGSSLTSDTTGTITVSGTEAGVTITAYKVAVVNFDYDVDQPVDPQYSWVGGLNTAKTYKTGMSVAQWVYQNYPSYIGYSTSGDVTDVSVTEITAAFASEYGTETDDLVAGFFDDLAAAIRSGVVVMADDGDDVYTQVSDDEGAATFEVAQGIYLMVTDNGVEYVHKVSSANVVPCYDDESGAWILSDVAMEVKRTPISIDKVITNFDEDGSSTVDAVGVGDTVCFEITAAVPGYPESAISQTYKISDELPDALTLDTGSIVVQGTYSPDGTPLAETLVADEDYVTLLDDDGNGFTITFVYDEIDQYEYVVVSYEATVNSAARTATVYENEATLTWTNSPYLTYGSDTTTTDDGIDLYTYGIDLIKTNTAGDTVLAGATFHLADATGATLNFVANEDGTYTLADEDVDTVYSPDLVTDEAGSIEVHGLDTGTYTLTETVAPDGYNKIGYDIEVVITGSVDGDTGELDGGALLSGLYSNTVAEADGRVDLTVTDTQGFELPQTGGIGTVIFIVAGAALMAGALVFFRMGRSLNKER